MHPPHPNAANNCGPSSFTAKLGLHTFLLCPPSLVSGPLSSYGILNDNYYGELKLDHHTHRRRATLARALGQPVEEEADGEADPSTSAAASPPVVRYHSGDSFTFTEIIPSESERADARVHAVATAMTIVGAHASMERTAVKRRMSLEPAVLASAFSPCLADEHYLRQTMGGTVVYDRTAFC